MNLTQITVFVENQPGRVQAITRLLKEHGIVVAFACVADTSEYGLVRLVVDKTDEAKQCLKEHGLSVKITEVVAVKVTDMLGGLDRVLDIIAKEGVSIDYFYFFMGLKNGYIGIKTENPALVTEALLKNGEYIVTAEEVSQAE